MRIATLTAGLILSMAFAGSASATSYFNFDWGSHNFNMDDWKSDFDRDWNDYEPKREREGERKFGGNFCPEREYDKPHDGGIVPEPSAALLFGLGSIFTTGAIRRRR